MPDETPKFEQLSPLFDPEVVDQVNANIGAANAQINTQRVDLLDTYERNDSPFIEPKKPEQVDWLNGFAASARNNIFSRGFWLTTRGIRANLHAGEARVYDPNARKFSTQIDINQWVSQNLDQLHQSPEGQRVLRNYLYGVYDGIDDAGYFFTLIGHDLETGHQKDLQSRAPITANLGGQLLDPAILVGGAAIRTVGGAGLQLIREGAQGAAGTLRIGKAINATRLLSAEALQRGTIGSYIGENIKQGIGFTIANEIGQRTVGVDAYERTLKDTAVDAAFGVIADSTTSAAFYGLGRAGRAVFGQTADEAMTIPRIKERARKAARTTVENYGTEPVDVVVEAAAQARRNYDNFADLTVKPEDLTGFSRTIDDDLTSLDTSYRYRDQLLKDKQTLESEINRLKNQDDYQPGLFDAVGDPDPMSQALLRELKAKGMRLDSRLEAINQQIAEVDEHIGSIEPRINQAAQDGAVHVESRHTDVPPKDGSAPEPETESGLFDRHVYKTREEALAAGYAGAGDPHAGFLDDQIAKLPEDELKGIREALASPEVIDSLKAIRDAISKAEAVPAEELHGNLEKALEAITNRSPNLKFNPASLGVGTVQTVKIDQAILYAETTGWIHATPIESIISALKQLGAFDELPGGRAGTNPVRNGKPVSQPPGNIPPSLEGRYAVMGSGDDIDLSLDLSNDATQATVKKLRNKLAEAAKIKKLGAMSKFEADAGDFTGLGVAGMAGQMGTGIAYSISDNKIVSSLYNIMFESPYTPKLFTNGSRIPGNLRTPMERLARSMSREADDIETQLINGFSDLRNRMGRKLRSNTPALMTAQSRQELANYYAMIEHLRILSSNSGPIDNATIKQLGEKYFGQITDEMIPSIMRSVEAVRREMPTTGRGNFSGRPVHIMRQKSTALLMREDATLEQALSIIRKAQNLPDAPITKDTIEQSIDVFSRMTAGKSPEINEADIAAALANRGGPEEAYLRQRLVTLWNKRLNGSLSERSARRLLADPAVRDLVRLDAVKALRGYEQQAVRAEMLEKITDYMLLLQRIEQDRGGANRQTRSVFTNHFRKYDEVLSDYQIALVNMSSSRGRQLSLEATLATDRVDRALEEAIDTLTEHATKQIDRIPTKASAGARTRRNRVLADQAQNLGKLLKQEAGFIHSTRSDTVLGRLGDAGLSLGRSSLLSRMAISMFADNPNAAAKAIAVGHGATYGKSFLTALKVSLGKAEREDLPEILQAMTSYHDNALHNLAANTDLGFVDAHSVTPGSDVGLLDKFVAVAESPISKASYIASGGKTLDDAMRTISALQALGELTGKKRSLIVRLDKAFESLKTGEKILDALKREKDSGIYTAYQHILKYMTREDIGIIADAIRNERYAIATVPNRLRGKTKIEAIHVVDEKATAGVQARQYAAQQRLGELADSWVEFRQLTVPHTVDRPGAAKLDPGSFVSRVATQFMSAGFAASRLAVLQTGNDAIGRRSFYLGTAIAAALGITYLRALIKGDDAVKRFENEWKNNRYAVIADAIGWSGVLGIVGDKGLATVSSFLLGNNAYNSRRNLDFAITTPFQAYIERAFAAITGARDQIVGGDTPTDYERRALRNVLSAGILDSTMSDLILRAMEPAQADEIPGAKQVIDWLYGPDEDKKK